MTLPSGTAIGSIVIEEKISSGVAGELYLGRQPGLERSVVLRKLTRDLLGSPALLERFRREARLAAQVIHPNVLQVFDFFAHRGDHYLVMEHVDGADLRSVLERGGRVPPRIASRIALEVARGLTELHRRGILHCNLRPENVLVSRLGEVKLAGLGHSRQLGEASPPSPLSPSPYTAPELNQGESVEPEVDVFSLGALLNELVSGTPPSEGGTLRPGMPSRLAWLIRSCLSPDPARRPALPTLARVLERSLGRAAKDSRMAIASWFWEVRMQHVRPDEELEEEPAALAAEPQARPRIQLRRLALPAAGLAAALLLLVLLTQLGGEGAPEREATPIEGLPPVAAAKAAPPELPTRVASERASVTFVAYPWAVIQVDDLPAFLTPRAEPIELAPGSHELVFRHPRYGKARQTLEVRPGEQRVVRHLFKKPGAP